MAEPTTDTSPNPGALPPETVMLSLDGDTDGEEETAGGEAEVQDEVAETGQEEPPQETSWSSRFEDSGDVNLLPGEHGRKVRRNLSELGILRKRYLDLLESRTISPAVPEHAQPRVEEKPPPIDRSSEEAFDASMDRRQQWYAEREARKLREEVSGIKEEASGHVQKMQIQADDQRRTEWVLSQKDCSPEVVSAIKELEGLEVPWAEKTLEQQYWAQQYWHDIGLRNLYKEAVAIAGGKSKAAKENERRAQVPRSVTPRPNGSGTARSVKPNKPFEGMSMDQIIDATDADWRNGSG